MTQRLYVSNVILHRISRTKATILPKRFYSGSNMTRINFLHDRKTQNSNCIFTFLHSLFRFICNKLNGQLPTFSSRRDREDTYLQISDLFESHFHNVSCQLDSDLFLWTGIVRDISNNQTEDEEEENIFVNLYTQEPLAFDPNLYPG